GSATATGRDRLRRHVPPGLPPRRKAKSPQTLAAKWVDTWHFSFYSFYRGDNYQFSLAYHAARHLSSCSQMSLCGCAEEDAAESIRHCSDSAPVVDRCVVRKKCLSGTCPKPVEIAFSSRFVNRLKCW